MKNRLNIIDALETARETQGVTQAELANRAGTSRVTVGRIEAGFDPKLSTVYELARALGLELTLVPKSLADEVQAFLRAGGRVLGQPAGASAPPSVVDRAAVVSARPRLKAYQRPSPSSGPASQIADSAQTRRLAQPLSRTVRTGKPLISASAAQVLGLNLGTKSGKDTQSTQGNQ